MTITPGSTIPTATVYEMTPDGPQGVTTDELFKGKRVVMFGIPGAFTPTCSAHHLPGFVQHADRLREKGIDSLICMAVNDAFVMGAWGKDQGVGDAVRMIADGDGELTKAMGMELDLSGKGLGLRCQRFALVVNDGVIERVEIDPAGTFEFTSAEAILSSL